ncbi:MAG TPA: hypothetical protein PKD51_05925 [Saprospiraceae bacterium]|nr:hypothetical protein [Saprospiraceae bacterium]
MNRFRDINDIQDYLPIYFKAWWLDLVFGRARWEYIIEKDVDGYITAILPYSIKRKFTFRVITMNSETHYSGPFIIKDKDRKNDSLVSYENKVIESVLNKLPSVDFVYFQCLPNTNSYLSFLWSNYTINISYTYKLDLILGKDVLLNEMKGSVRTDIKKCIIDGLNVGFCNDAQDFMVFLKESFDNNKKDLPYNLMNLNSIVETSLLNNSSFIRVCKNKNDEIVAAAFVIFDHDVAYYFAGTNNVIKYGSAALSYCLWESIQYAKSIGKKSFDFEGSDIKGIEHYFRNFGGTLVPIYRVFKARNKFMRLLAYIQNPKLFG